MFIVKRDLGGRRLDKKDKRPRKKEVENEYGVYKSIVEFN